MSEIKKKLGDLLVDAKYITKAQLEECLVIQKTAGKRLAEILITESLITEEQMIEALGTQLSMPRLDLRKLYIDPEATKTISEQLARKYTLIPIRRVDAHTLVVVVNDPLNVFAVDDVKIMTGCDVRLALSTKNNILSAIERYYGQQNTEQALEDTNKQFVSLERQVEEDDAEVTNSPVVRLVDLVVKQAIIMSASDIHIEPMEHYIRIRFRIDGVLQEIMRPQKATHSAMITRIKLLAEMEISEKRIPQDGRYEAKIDGKPVDLRISVLPTAYGEKAVIRILERSSFLVDKRSLGFSEKNLELFDKICKSPHGIVLVTGPTGSGKSTTLYTMLREQNSIDKNIITIEDPIEYRLDGISQVQVNQKAGLTFSAGLRSMLRQDPDVIMIGEIRDTETAKLAVRSAITGHLVLSTIHTNDTASTVFRLIDMEIENYFVATAVVGIIAQRLVRRICTNCKTKITLSEYEQSLIGGGVLEAYVGKGCTVCSNTGYKGRIAVHEIMPITRDIRNLIMNNASMDELRDASINAGMTTLSQNMHELVVNGVSTVEEFARVAYNYEG